MTLDEHASREINLIRIKKSLSHLKGKRFGSEWFLASKNPQQKFAVFERYRTYTN